MTDAALVAHGVTKRFGDMIAVNAVDSISAIGCGVPISPGPAGTVSDGRNEPKCSQADAARSRSGRLPPTIRTCTEIFAKLRI